MIIYIMQMELVASPCAQVSAITSDLRYMYSIDIFTIFIHCNVDRCTVRIVRVSFCWGGGGGRGRSKCHSLLLSM